STLRLALPPRRRRLRQGAVPRIAAGNLCPPLLPPFDGPFEGGGLLLRRRQRPSPGAASRSAMSMELHLVLLFPFGMSRRPPSWRPSLRARVRKHSRCRGRKKGLSAGRTCLLVHAHYLACQVDKIKATARVAVLKLGHVHPLQRAAIDLQPASPLRAQ